MKFLTGNTVSLRALEPSDLQFLFDVENEEAHWEISSTQTPYSKFLLKKYIENAHQDIYEAKQLRLVIANKENNDPIGLIDLFDFNPTHKRAGIGLLVQQEHRQKGVASEALELLISYAFHCLHLHQLYANIMLENKISIALFEAFKFECIGTKKDWIFSKRGYKDEALYQLISKTKETCLKR
jgi:diamine N-acetyltransferase